MSAHGIIYEICNLESVRDLAASRPVDKITVKDITDQCGISRNTFYYHYQDIYQVLKAYVQYSAEHVIELMVEDEGEDGKAGLKGNPVSGSQQRAFMQSVSLCCQRGGQKLPAVCQPDYF